MVMTISAMVNPLRTRLVIFEKALLGSDPEAIDQKTDWLFDSIELRSASRAFPSMAWAPERRAISNPDKREVVVRSPPGGRRERDAFGSGERKVR